MPSVEVYILGQKYTIKGEASEDDIKEISSTIDAMIKDVCDKYPNINQNKALILTLFNMAEAMQKLNAELDGMTSHIEQQTDMLASIIE